MNMTTFFIVFLSLLNVSMIIAYLSIKYQMHKMVLVTADLLITNSNILTNGNNFDSKTDEDIDKENFIKFLSDSREWAFNYIEESQETVKEVIDYLNNKNNDFDKAYAKKLQTLIPESLN